MSPGWRESASQIASSVEKRIARALPVLRIERLASVMSTRSASSVRVIRRSWSRSASLTAIATSHRPFQVVPHVRALRKHTGQQEREEYGEPAVDRKAGIQAERMRRRRNGRGDYADHYTESVQRDQRPGDRLQTVRVLGDKRVARADRLDDREQPLEDDVVQRDRGEAEHGDGAHAHDQSVGVRRRRELE